VGSWGLKVGGFKNQRDYPYGQRITQLKTEFLMKKDIIYFSIFFLGVFRFLPLIFVPNILTELFSEVGFIVQYICMVFLVVLFLRWRRKIHFWFSLSLLSLTLFCAFFPRLIMGFDIELTIVMNDGREEKDYFSPVPGMKYVARNASRFGRNRPKFCFRSGIFVREELIVSYSSFRPDGYVPFQSEIQMIYPNGWYWYKPSD
jgi:hypothetical protein